MDWPRLLHLERGATRTRRPSNWSSVRLAGRNALQPQPWGAQQPNQRGIALLARELEQLKARPCDKGQHYKMSGKALKKALRVPKDEREQRIHAGEDQNRKEHYDQHEAGSTARMQPAETPRRCHRQFGTSL